MQVWWRLGTRINWVWSVVVLTAVACGGGAQDEAPVTATTASKSRIGLENELYVVDQNGNSLRHIDTGGNVTTLTTDAIGASAVAVGPDGSVYVASPHTGRLSVWTGTELVALTDAEAAPGERVSGDNVHSPLDAWLRPSHGLAFDAGRLVFSDMGNDAVRALGFGGAPERGTLETLVPETAPDDALDDGEPAGLMLPRGLVPYGDGYAVADTGHHRVVVVKAANAVPGE